MGLTIDDWRDGKLTDRQRREVVEHMVEIGKERLGDEFEAFLETGLVANSLVGLFAFAKDFLRKLYLGGVLIVVGPGGMGAEERRALADQVARQFDEFLDPFQEEIRSGAKPLDGTFTSRIRQYGDATWGIAQNVLRVRRRVEGMTEEMLVLSAADHCAECPADAKLGWKPIGTLDPIGSRACRGACRCHWAFR